MGLQNANNLTEVTVEKILATSFKFTHIQAMIIPSQFSKF